MNYREAIHKAFGEEQETLLLSPSRGIAAPDAEQFFEALQEVMQEDYILTADTTYKYCDTHGYGWLAFDCLYIAIPEYESYEFHTGKWAVFSTLVEAVQQCQHGTWRENEDRAQTIRDTNQFLSQQ
jgi:Zn-finger protein